MAVYCKQQVRRYEVSRQPWDPMDPPEVGPRRSPGLSGHVKVHGLVHPVIPSGRLCALFPAFLGLRYCVRSYILPLRGEALSGYASWVGSRGPSVLGWVPRPGGSRPIWDGYPDLGVAFLLGVGVGGG